MCFDDFAARDLSWLDGSGPAAEIVVSSRVRLARNLRGRRFAHFAPAPELAAIRQEVIGKVVGRGTFAGGGAIEMADCTAVQRRCLQEKHLASPDFVGGDQQRSLLVSADLSRCIMVNEEDHLRIQVFRSGFDPLATCQDALALDSELEETLSFAFSDDIGYLTACPTNVGTGFRLSVLIHLPGLVMAGEIEKILNSLRQLQFTVRGLFGEGSAVRGAMFQVSNLGTLGRSEDGLTTDFSRHVSKVIQYEKLAREKLQEKDPQGIADLVNRSLAILRHARLVTTREAFDRLNHVRLGTSLGLLPAVAPRLLNNAMVHMQSAHLQLRSGRALKGRDRSAARAEYLRGLLA